MMDVKISPEMVIDGILKRQDGIDEIYHVSDNLKMTFHTEFRHWALVDLDKGRNLT